MWQTFNNAITGEYLQYGQLFSQLQEVLFGRLFLLVMTIVPCVFLLHYMVVGPKRFDHDGPQIFFFGLFARIIHWIAAISFSFLVLTGLMVAGRAGSGIATELGLLSAVNDVHDASTLENARCGKEAL